MKRRPILDTLVNSTPAKQRGKFLLYVVPETQPSPSRQSAIYGGYHITLFPDHKLPENFDIKNILKEFDSDNSTGLWRLPEDTEIVTQNSVVIMLFDSPTINKLMAKMERPNGPFESHLRWVPIHLTLGETGVGDPNPDELANIFMNETKWYVQLVEKIPKVKIPTSIKDYDFVWLKDQRVLLKEN